MNRQRIRKRGQSAIEYMILATTVMVVILIGFDERSGVLIQGRNLAEGILNAAFIEIMGTTSEVAARTGYQNYP